MKIAIISHGTFYNPKEILSGNSIRGYFLSKGLVEYGIKVLYLYPSTCSPKKIPSSIHEGIEVKTYHSAMHLEMILRSEQLIAIFVGYYELVRDIPQDIGIPIIIDLPGPRILELLFQMSNPEISETASEMIRLLSRADHFVVGTYRQKCFLTPWLLLAGFGTNAYDSIDVIPLSTALSNSIPPKKTAVDEKINLVYAGVIWPWRDPDSLFEQMKVFFHEETSHPFHVFIISGKYVYSGDTHDESKFQKLVSDNQDFSKHSLMPYDSMQEFLMGHCHIGIEFSEINIERIFSQSFRIVEYLKLGIPVICSYYLEIADLIKEYNAGWIIHSPLEIGTILRDIAQNPDQIEQKGKNAERLVRNEFDYRKTIIPLVSYIANQPKVSLKSTSISLNSSQGRAMIVHGQPCNYPSGIAIITRPDIYPPNHGAAVKIERTAWALSFHTQVFIITSSNDFFYRFNRGKCTKAKYPKWLTNQFNQDINAIRQTLREKSIPEADMFLYYPLYDPDFLKKGLFLNKEYNVTNFQAEFPIFAYPFILMKELFGCQLLIVEHNIEYYRLASQYDLSQEARVFIKDTELFCCEKSDLIITVSENDRNILIQDGIPEHKIHYIPHGVDLESFDNLEDQVNVREQYSLSPEQPILVYHGTYLYPPNVESIQILSEKILPIINKKGVYPKVLAIGAHPPKNLRFHKDIVFTGAVKCVAPWIEAADIAVVPLVQGGGTRMKVLDYFAARLPVVSTSKGVEGIPVMNNKEVIICDNWESFADSVIDLINNPDKRERMGSQGRLFVERLDWRIIGTQYYDLITGSESVDNLEKQRLINSKVVEKEDTENIHKP